MQRGLCACVFLSLLVTPVSLAKTGKSIEVPFGRGLSGGGQKKTIQYNTIQYNTKFVKRHVAVASEALANRSVKKQRRRRTNVL